MRRANCPTGRAWGAGQGKSTTLCARNAGTLPQLSSLSTAMIRLAWGRGRMARRWRSLRDRQADQCGSRGSGFRCEMRPRQWLSFFPVRGTLTRSNLQVRTGNLAPFVADAASRTTARPAGSRGLCSRTTPRGGTRGLMVAARRATSSRLTTDGRQPEGETQFGIRTNEVRRFLR